MRYSNFFKLASFSDRYADEGRNRAMRTPTPEELRAAYPDARTDRLGARNTGTDVHFNILGDSDALARGLQESQGRAEQLFDRNPHLRDQLATGLERTYQLNEGNENMLRDNARSMHDVLHSLTPAQYSQLYRFLYQPGSVQEQPVPVEQPEWSSRYDQEKN
jgi:hypothetical protein